MSYLVHCHRNTTGILRSGNRGLFVISMTQLFFEILSPLPLTRRLDARKLFAVWRDTAPETLPDRIGNHEPLRLDFSIDDIERAFGIWEHHVLLKRVAKPKLASSIFMQYGPHRKHSTWSITVSDRKHIDMQSMKNLISASSVEFSADFGFIHSPNDFDIDVGLATESVAFLDTKRSKKSLFLTTHTLKNTCQISIGLQFLANPMWTSFLGNDYYRPRLFKFKSLATALY